MTLKSPAGTSNRSLPTQSLSTKSGELKNLPGVDLGKLQFGRRPNDRDVESQLTFINEKSILGVIEHNSRKCLSLVTLKDKTSITILRKLLDILEYHPKPQFIRSDNELCFNSKLIKFGLWFLGIEKQTIDKHSPWHKAAGASFALLKATQRVNHRDVVSIMAESKDSLAH